MELQVVLIGAVVFVISAVLIYLISAFTMKEKTFEEVIAEQKRRQEEELLKVKQEKKAEKDQTRKRRKGKEKVKGDQSPKVSFSDSEAKEHKMVNLELEPEIIEPVEASKPLKMGKKKDKPTKPILHNKDEKTPVTSDENVEEIVHRGPTPRDDVELKMIHESKKEKQRKKDAKKQEQQAPVVEEMIQVVEAKVQAAAPPTSYKDSGNSKLISSVKAASLSDNEAQSLIEILLTKQGGSAASLSSDWNKKSQKGDPVALLRKQLEEKERSLQEEQQRVFAANNKVKEVRQELNQEKIQSQSLEKSYKDKVDYQGREIQALHARIQHTHDQHMGESNQMRTHIQKLEAQAGDQGRLQRLVEENAALRESLNKTQSEALSPSDANNLKQKVAIMEKELSNNALKINSSENSKRSLEQKLAKMETDMKKLESQQSSTGNVMEKRVDELSQELRKGEAKNTALSKDLHTKEQAVDTVQKECLYLKSKLQELERSLMTSDQSTKQMEEKLKAADRLKIDTEGNLKNLQKKIESLDQEKSGLVNEIQGLKQENSSLNTELKTTKDSLQTEAASKQPNGDIHDTDNMISVEEHEKMLSVKVSEIGKLTKEVETRKTELSDLHQQFETQKKKNNELREKNWKAMDALAISEKSVSEKIQSAIKENRDELAASRTEAEKFDKTVMERLFPDISVNKQNHKDWMTEFEKQVSSHLKSLKQSTSATSDNSAKYETKVHELESQKSDLESRLRELESNRDSLQSTLLESETSSSKLQAQISQYRNVLAETENKLTQLENSVEAEEKKWQEKLQAKDTELQQARDETSKVAEAASSSGGQEDLSDMGFAYRCLEKSLTTIVDQMKDKVEDLESQLKNSDDRCSQLQSRLKETEGKVADYNVQIVELQKTSATVIEINTEVEKLRTDLTTEQKKNKDLASQIVKLNGIIKTGHDALTQEQNLVKKLQEQMSNGSDKQNSTSVPNSSSTEVDKLKAALTEKEKQLDKEMSTNKVLSQKLASSQSSLNEAGTSV